MAGTAKIITVDIETSPYLVWAWQLWDTSIGNDMVVADRTILATTIKELGKKPVAKWAAYGDVKAEYGLLAWLHKHLCDSDIVVTQNGNRFDLPIINARFAAHRFSPPAPYARIDTRAVAKRHFKFMSNKLEWLAPQLTDTDKSKHKKYPGFELWKETLAGNKRAMAEMVRYNIQDVIATEKLYLALRPWITNHPNVALIEAKPDNCPKCNSGKLQSRGFQYTQARKYRRFQCTACGGWTRSTKSEAK